MRLLIKMFLVAFGAALFSLSACNNNTAPKTDEKSGMTTDTVSRPLAAGEKVIYQCEMDPDVKSDKPGKCPKCGMDLQRVIVKDTVK